MSLASISPRMDVVDTSAGSAPSRSSWTGALRRPGTAMMVAAWLTLVPAEIVPADPQMQDWIPASLEMPEDAEVLKDRAVGSSVRLFSIATEADVGALFAAWEESLRENGYEITESDADVLQQSIEFSGDGVTNAKIILSPAEHGDRSVIEFDATLN